MNIHTLQTAADYLSVSPTTIRRLVDRRQIRHTRVGCQIRFRQQWLDDYLGRNEVRPGWSR